MRPGCGRKRAHVDPRGRRGLFYMQRFRALVFLVALGFFLICFGGDYHRWRSLGEDTHGATYYWEQRSAVRVRYSVFRIWMRKCMSTNKVQEQFEIDCANHTLTNLTHPSPAEIIPSNSMADTLRVQLLQL